MLHLTYHTHRLAEEGQSRPGSTPKTTYKVRPGIETAASIPYRTQSYPDVFRSDQWSIPICRFWLWPQKTRQLVHAPDAGRGSVRMERPRSSKTAPPLPRQRRLRVRDSEDAAVNLQAAPAHGYWGHLLLWQSLFTGKWEVITNPDSRAFPCKTRSIKYCRILGNVQDYLPG